MGMPEPSLLDSTASVTIRHSESEAIASETATTSLSLLDASAAAGLVKPAGPEDGVIVESLQKIRTNQSHRAGESVPRDIVLSQFSPARLRRGRQEKRQKWGEVGVMPMIPVIRSRFLPATKPRQPPGGQAPTFHRRAGSPSTRIRGSARRASARCEWPGRSTGHSRTGRRHGCSRRARCRRS